MKYTYQQLYDFANSTFLKIGCSQEHAATATQVLLSADRRGVDSHGIARLVGYVRLWEAGRVNTSPDIKIIYESPSTATIDGDRGLGLVVAPFAMQVAIEKAKTAGTGWVAVKNSNHFGIAGIHAMMALKENMIGYAMTNASALVAPTFSKERMLGTNPIAVAIPAKHQPPFVADMATTTVANGKLEILQRLNEEAPYGWVQDANGLPSQDASILKNKGALLPLGGDPAHGSYKGYALGSIVDILTGVLSGASYGPWAPPFPAYVPMPQNMPGDGLGHFFGAMRTDAFRPTEAFLLEMDHWIERFRNAQPSNEAQKVLIPGDPEREAELDRSKNGIPVHKSVIKDLSELAEKLKITPLLP
ncbi:MAG TPA: Ldh family oxidoreductase [Edaphocola sp.]|nr:Ldh family oxidoreductase [Edaphocola sp.]